MSVSARHVSPSFDPSALHARIRQAMPDLDDAAVERLAGICAELPPPSQPAANAADEEFYATARGAAYLTQALEEQARRYVDHFEWLLHSIADAGREDGDWALALCRIGQEWALQLRRELDGVEPALRAVARMAQQAAGEQA